MKSSVSSEGVASKYTERVVRYVNKCLHLFAVPRPHLTVSGPNKSTPVKVNGRWYASSLALGSDPINCSKGLAFILRHLMQLLIVFFTRPLPPIIQNILRSSHKFVLFHYEQQTHGSDEQSTGSRDGALVEPLDVSRPTRVPQLSAIVLLPVVLHLLILVSGFPPS